MKGYIYKIYDNTNGNVYYGSTIQGVSQRLACHRAHYKKYCKGEITKCKSFDILCNNDYSYSVIEEVEYNNRYELFNRERYYIENFDCINKCIPNRTNKEYIKKYKEDNKEKIKEHQKKYVENHREKINKIARNYYNKNKEKLKEKIECECGCSITKSGFSQHKKSKKHLLYLDSINAKSEVSKE